MNAWRAWSAGRLFPDHVLSGNGVHGNGHAVLSICVLYVWWCGGGMCVRVGSGAVRRVVRGARVQVRCRRV